MQERFKSDAFFFIYIFSDTNNKQVQTLKVPNPPQKTARLYRQEEGTRKKKSKIQKRFKK